LDFKSLALGSGDRGVTLSATCASGNMLSRPELRVQLESSTKGPWPTVGPRLWASDGAKKNQAGLATVPLRRDRLRTTALWLRRIFLLVCPEEEDVLWQ
jgi:hypothetical protein